MLSPKVAALLGLAYRVPYEEMPLLPPIEWEKPTRVKTGKREAARRRKQMERDKQ